jgi:hypothetical protein
MGMSEEVNLTPFCTFPPVDADRRPLQHHSGCGCHRGQARGPLVSHRSKRAATLAHDVHDPIGSGESHWTTLGGTVVQTAVLLSRRGSAFADRVYLRTYLVN